MENSKTIFQKVAYVHIREEVTLGCSTLISSESIAKDL